MNKIKLLKKTQVCFIGDSLTDGCDVKHYYPSFDTLNRGIGGDTTTGVLRRLDISVYAVNPDAVVMLIGTNNYLNMFNDYEDILKEYKTNIPNAKVILCSLTPVASNMGGTIRNTTYATYNVKIKEYANKYSYEFVDIFTPLVNLDEMLIVPEYTIDGIHFTDAGYQIISSIVTNKLNEIL